jgi:hypothetical protein
MTNEQRLAAAEAKAAELQAEIAQVRAELAAEEEKAWEPWKPEIDGQYCFVDAQGLSLKTRWDNDNYDTARHAISNVFPTKEAAERHALRLRSMRPTCPVPKVGERCWVAMVDNNSQLAEMWRWENDKADYAAYNQGRVFATKEAAKAWIAEFGDAWTTLEDEAK